MKKIRITRDIYDLITQAKTLTRAQMDVVLGSRGVETDPRIDDRTTFYLAFSFLQNSWHEARKTPSNRLRGIREGHRERLETYQRALERVKNVSPTSKFSTVATVPLNRRRYRFNPWYLPRAEELKLVTDGFKGFRKAVYDTILFAGIDHETGIDPRVDLSFDEVLTETRKRGIIFGGKDGGRNEVQFQLRRLTKLGVIITSPAQGEL